MVKLTKVPLMKEEFCLEITPNFIIPIRDTVMIILICALFSFAMNYGASFAQDVVKFSAYISENGVWDPIEGRYLKCWPAVDGNSHVVYDCENRTGVAPGRGDIFKPVNFTEVQPYASGS